ncbi:MAG: AEC family transporter [Rubrivivax sp.]|nr:AEC family transporter [Rubrivivax sp.]
MTLAIFHKLLAIVLTVALGWLAGNQRWLGGGGTGDRGIGSAARALSDAAFYLFVPALLFRTMVRLDFAAMPWRTLAAFFVPALAYVLAVYLWQHRARARTAAAAAPAAAPATRTITASYGNAVQLGIPVAAALFGETGLALHIALVSLHGLLLLTLLTVLVEIDLARADHTATLASTVRVTVRNAVIHPVTLPVLAGLAWNFTGLGLHPVINEALAGLGLAVVPVCLVLIGLTLAQYGLRGHLRGAMAAAALKLLVLPALVLAVAYGFFGLTGVPLAVVVMLAALPVGSNALVFAQRYDTLQAQATTAIVFSTLAFTATATFWLGVLAWLGRHTGG